MRIVGSGLAVELGGTSVFRDVSFDIPPTAITVIAGPSGSGKTTLLGVLAAAIHPTRGQLRYIDGEVEATHPRWAWISQAATLLQDRTARDNVALALLANGAPLDVAQEAAHRHLNSVWLGHRIDYPARSLSGGEQQRVAFARALASDAEVIFADEPTASLDAGNTSQLCNLLRLVAHQRTVVVATHDPEVMAVADRVIAMRSS